MKREEAEPKEEGRAERQHKGRRKYIVRGNAAGYTNGKEMEKNLVFAANKT